MRTTAQLPPIWTTPTLIALIAIGCSSGDERLVELSRQSADRQAEQNRLVETNNRQVLEATDKLVEADAKSRIENFELHRQIEAERSGVNQQRDALEQERRQQLAIAIQSSPNQSRRPPALSRLFCRYSSAWSFFEAFSTNQTGKRSRRS
ncbi:MAG TPA: hypothetical protein VEI07_08770 [Planctomycetaceae bacterium]|nr:hypothetical protein [Planctomycetaceae bacterium]